MAPPNQVSQWLNKTYPRPMVDPEWLEGCYSWIQEELHLNPGKDMQAILDNVNTQLLESDFSDSMVAGTGFPRNVVGADNLVLKGPILVEVVNIMEIGHSAYSLLQVHESRVEYRKQAQIRSANGDEEERKPMPKYPRSMLQLHLSDGQLVLPAVENQSLPQLELGETPLGYKMIIKNVAIRRGVVMLKPECVELKGHRTADRDERREATFVRSLKLRMGDDVPAEEPPAAAEPGPTMAPAHATPPRNLTNPLSPAQSPERSPLRDISPPPKPHDGPPNAIPANALEHADDISEPRRRKRPSRAGRSPSPDPPPREQLQRSRYFSSLSRDQSPSAPQTDSIERGLLSEKAPRASVTVTGPGSGDAMKEFARSIGLTPPRPRAADVPIGDGDAVTDIDTDKEDPVPSKPVARQRRKGKGKARESLEPVFGDASSDDFGFDFEMNASFLAQVDRAEQEFLANSQDPGQSQSQQQTQAPVKHALVHVKTEIFSQAPGKSGAAAETSASPPGSRPSSVPASSGAARGAKTAAALIGDKSVVSVINISDDEDGLDKENVPVPARRVRRRVVPAAEEVIELSD